MASLQAGKIELDGDRMFVIVSDNRLTTPEEAKLEVHNRYIDIQAPVSGGESFGWANRRLLESPEADFDGERDIQFFADRPTTFVRLEVGECIIFFPEDAHAPLVGEGSLKKVIVKVAAD